MCVSLWISSCHGVTVAIAVGAGQLLAAPGVDSVGATNGPVLSGQRLAVATCAVQLC